MADGRRLYILAFRDLRKGLSFFYLVLSLLLYWMIRADHSRKSWDFTILAIFIGMAWQAHPSVVLAGPALIMFVMIHFKVLGWKGMGSRSLLAAASAWGPSFILLPVLSRNESTAAFGAPSNLLEILNFLMRSRFTTRKDVYTMEPERRISVCRYFWEGMLLLGTVLSGAGLVRLARHNRPSS